MADLITVEEARLWQDIPDTMDDALLAVLTAAVSSSVRLWCGRSFNVDAAQVASARYFEPLDYCSVVIDDAYEITAVATDDADDGAWSTTWSASDYYTLPANGIGPDGQDGWPYTKIMAVESRTFPWAARPSVKVTAKWGWEALPDSVALACRMLLAEFYKAKDGGYATFTADNGFAVIRRNAVVRDLLQPFRTQKAGEGRFRVVS